ncbi:MAG: hypothetical protein AABY13_05315, partial [Nanoarchaeota archaeon]
FDFNCAPRHTWCTPDKNHPLAREATGLLLHALQRDNGWNLDTAVVEVTLPSFESVPIDKYGTTLGGMLSIIYNSSPGTAVRDYLRHHPDPVIRERYATLTHNTMPVGVRKRHNAMLRGR